MAYGTYIQGRFTDFAGAAWEVNLQVEGHTAAPSALDMPFDPLRFDVGDGATDDLPVVLGTRCRMRFFINYNQYPSLFTPDKRKYRVEVKKAGAVWFVGWLSPNQYHGAIDYASEVELTAICGLGELAETPYQQPNGTPYTGMERLAYIVTNHILARLDLGLWFNMSIGYGHANVAALNGTMEDTWVDTATYQDMNCRDVLLQLLQNCRILQQGGQWWIEGYEQLKKEAPTYYQYRYDGELWGTFTLGRRVAINTAADAMFVPPVSQTGLKPVNKVKIKTVLNNDENLFKNGTFEDTGSWTMVQEDTSNLTLLAVSEKGKQLLMMEKYVYEGEGRSWPGAYCYTRVYLGASTAKMRLEFGYIIRLKYSRYTDLRLKFRVWLDGDSGTDYELVPGADGDAMLLAWSDTAPATYIDVTTKAEDGTLTTSTLKNFGDDELSSSIKRFENLLDALPEAGYLHFQFYYAYSESYPNRYELNSRTCLHNLKLYPVSGEEKALDLNTTDELSNPASYVSPLTYELMQGNHAEPNSPLLSPGILMYLPALEYLQTTGWTRDGKTDNLSYQQLLALLYLQRRRTALEVLQGRTLGIIDPAHVVVDNEYGKLYTWCGVSFNPKTRECDGRLVELLPDEQAYTYNDDKARTTGDELRHTGTDIRHIED